MYFEIDWHECQFVELADFVHDMVRNMIMLSAVCTVENIAMSLDLFVVNRGRTRKMGELSIRLDASVITRSSSVDGT